MTNCEITAADFRAADVSDVNFEGQEFKREVSFVKTRGYRTNFKDANLDDAIWTDSDFSWSVFTNVDFRNTTIGVAKLEYSIFQNANLSGMTLSSWKIEGGQFTRANLSRHGCNWRAQHWLNRRSQGASCLR